MVFVVQDAASALRSGGAIILHDGVGRENEADMIFLAKFATPEKIRKMRKECGGLICIATDADTSKRLDLQFENDTLSKCGSKLISGMCKSRMKYGDHPAFTVSINHLKTFTGITDNDRALTCREFGELVERKGSASDFSSNFRAIGHVFLLSSRGLGKRRGHTELSVALAELAGVAPALVLCEMLSDSGNAATKEEAEEYAKKNGFPFLSGEEIVRVAGGKK
jgi:3,4-dihydroxy 2-butanone 4-phosphate synthase